MFAIIDGGYNDVIELHRVLKDIRDGNQSPFNIICIYGNLVAQKIYFNCGLSTEWKELKLASDDLQEHIKEIINRETKSMG